MWVYLYTWPCLLLVFVRENTYMYFVYIYHVEYLVECTIGGECRTECVTKFFVCKYTCAWLRKLHACVCLEVYTVVRVFRSGLSILGTRVTQPTILLASMGWNCMAGLTVFFCKILRKTQAYFPCLQDHHLSSEMIITWQTCQKDKCRHSFHGNVVVSCANLHQNKQQTFQCSTLCETSGDKKLPPKSPCKTVAMVTDQYIPFSSTSNK